LLAAARARRDGRHDHPGAEEGKLAAPTSFCVSKSTQSRNYPPGFLTLLFHALSRIAGAGSERFRG